MSDPHLLVPVALEALVVNRSDRKRTVWSVAPKQYTGVERFEPVEPPPFVRGTDRPRIGITLLWSLPDALTHGKTLEGGIVEFPRIPNRWLVVRSIIATGDNNASTRMQGWVVESDYMGKDGSSPYIDPVTGTYTEIGRCLPLNGWAEDASAARVPLTAIGPGDVTFSAYSANLDNVLSFYDGLTDVQDVEMLKKDLPATLSYMVIGWYSNPLDDVMTGPQLFDGGWTTPAQWLEMMKIYKWSVGDDKDLQRAIVDATGSENNSPESYPRRSLYHGMVYGVNWNGRDVGDTQSGVPSVSRSWAERGENKPGGPDRNDFPHIVIANSPTDAVAALMEYLSGMDDDVIDVSTMLQAVEYGLLKTYDTPGGEIKLDQEIHKEWFDPVAGGSFWEVVPKERLDASDKEALPLTPDKEALPLTPDQKKKLDDLNKAQIDLDDALRAIHSWRKDLYAAWWKKEHISHATGDYPGRPSKDGATDNFNLKKKFDIQEIGVPASVKEIEKKLRKEDIPASVIEIEAELRKRLADARDNLKDAFDGRLDLESDSETESQATHVLKQHADSRFWKPVDPVILMYGGQRSLKHGADGRFTEDGTLFCRFSRGNEGTGQTLHTLKGESIQFSSLAPIADPVKPGQTIKDPRNRKKNLHAFNRSVISASAASRSDGANPFGNLPNPVVDLVKELILLDPHCAALFASDKKPSSIWQPVPEGSSIQALVTDAGFKGVRPSPIAVEAWAPPWAPLFMSWRITWYPSYEQLNQVHENWSYNGLDFDWTGSGSLDTLNAITYQGRTLLTPTSTEGLYTHLEKVFAEIDERASRFNTDSLSVDTVALLKKLKKRLQSADMLSHSLTGFNEQLLQLDRNQFYNPNEADVAASLLGDVERYAPIPYKNGVRDPDDNYYPVRAGHFKLERFWVVDEFGQVFDPILERGQSPASFSPLRGTGMAIQSRDERLATPFIKQRLDTQVVQLPPRIVQPSRVLFRFIDSADDSKEVRLNHGTSPICGWLLPNHLDNAIHVFNEKGETLGAITMTGSNATSKAAWMPTPEQVSSGIILNPHLNKLVKGVVGDDSTKFVHFLEVIDSTLWTTDPQGQRGNNLSLLVGRPLAVLRAKVQLQLETDLATNHAWGASGDGDFSAIEFPIQFGHPSLRDDGVLGLYKGGDYTTFFSTKNVLETSTYVTFQDDSFCQLRAASATDEHAMFVTLLLDPRGSINLRSGINPTRSVRLPGRFTKDALEAMDVTFRTGPLLNEKGHLRMPLPAEIPGTWSWIAHSVDLEPQPDIQPAITEARFGDQPTRIHEGWLKLSEAFGQGASED